MVVAALLAPDPVRAFDATGVDIIGLRLGMQENEVASRLAQQGYTIKTTPGAIVASTRDGHLQIALTADRGVTEIRYVFNGHDLHASAQIMDGILTRFGDPAQAKPPTWCRRVGQDGICPADQASLTFLEESLTLLLRTDADGRP
jgi:hypothetical protein